MYQEEVEKLCMDIEGKVTFEHVSNGKYNYENSRVLRYKILNEGSTEELVVEMTGFPVINNEQS